MSAESPRRLLLSERREGGRLYLPGPTGSVCSA